MRKVKKLALLLLSLVLLIGTFTVLALAEETEAPTPVATVVYPDGTEIPYEVAGEIKSTIENGLYYGKGNTLYKDNSGAGWVYTDADGNTVTEITDDMIAAGAKIIASGLDKIYYTVTKS